MKAKSFTVNDVSRLSVVFYDKCIDIIYGDFLLFTTCDSTKRGSISKWPIPYYGQSCRSGLSDEDASHVILNNIEFSGQR